MTCVCSSVALPKVLRKTVKAVSDFHETNVRTYVHERGRDRGAWFFSLDAALPGPNR